MSSNLTQLLAKEAKCKKQKNVRNSTLQQLQRAIDGIADLKTTALGLFEARQFSLLDSMADQSLINLNIENNKFINLLIDADDNITSDAEFKTDQKNVREILGKMTNSRESYRELLKNANLLDQTPALKPADTDPTLLQILQQMQQSMTK